MASKSKLFRLLTAGKRASRMRRSTVRASRSSSSSSISRVRWRAWSRFSAAPSARTRADVDRGGVRRRAGRLLVLAQHGRELQLLEMVARQDLGRLGRAGHVGAPASASGRLM